MNLKIKYLMYYNFFFYKVMYCIYVSSFTIYVSYITVRSTYFKGEKSFLVLIFSSDFYFNPYILFLSLLISIMKNASYFSLCHYIKNKES